MGHLGAQVGSCARGCPIHAHRMLTVFDPACVLQRPPHRRRVASEPAEEPIRPDRDGQAEQDHRQRREQRLAGRSRRQGQPYARGHIGRDAQSVEAQAADQDGRRKGDQGKLIPSHSDAGQHSADSGSQREDGTHDGLGILAVGGELMNCRVGPHTGLSLDLEPASEIVACGLIGLPANALTEYRWRSRPSKSR